MKRIKFFLFITLMVISLNMKAQSYDTDAQAFFTASGITDTVQMHSINHLVLDLKAAGLWTKMKAVYPFVGSTAAAHKWNLKDPRDLDAAYRLTFYGTITHSATGALPDGSTGYADTHLAANALDQNSVGFSFYSNTNNNYGGIDIGTDYMYYNFIDIRQGDNSVFGINTQYYGLTSGLTTDGRGLFTLSRTSSSQTVLYRNGTSIATSSSASVTPEAINIKLFASELYAVPREFGNKECAFASLGDGLVDSNATSLSTVVTTYLYNLTHGGGGGPAGSGGGGGTTSSDTTWVRSGDTLHYNNGNVGIGTSHPQTKLAVNGTITATKLKVTQTGWSDYVFDKNYKLPTLKETEKYIKLNQHLSGIPSTKEVEQNGLDVGNNQSLLLKKIEELTLIIIEQDKKLENQNSRIKALEKHTKNIK